MFGNNPVVISETSKPYNYELNQYPDNPSPGSAVNDEPGTKVDWFTQITSPASRAAFPNLISVNW